MTADIIYSDLLGCYLEIEYGTKLRSIRFVRHEKHLKERRTHDCTYELERYFNGEPIDFSYHVEISHLSPFVQKVLEETRKIRYGETMTYSELAEKIGSRAIRAVGRALGKNPVPIIIPCHRVVAKNGIGGDASGTDVKTRFLEHEKRNANNLY